MINGYESAQLRYDVIEVALSNLEMRLMAENKSKKDAEAAVNLAVARRGCEGRFYVECDAGKYKDGDTYVS